MFIKFDRGADGPQYVHIDRIAYVVQRTIIHRDKIGGAPTKLRYTLVKYQGGAGAVVPCSPEEFMDFVGEHSTDYRRAFYVADFVAPKPPGEYLENKADES